MDNRELPLGFGFALAQRPDAMKRFSDLPPAQQDDLVQRARAVSSRAEMDALVQQLETT